MKIDKLLGFSPKLDMFSLKTYIHFYSYIAKYSSERDVSEKSCCKEKLFRLCCCIFLQ
jgi:hypothetical protein